MTEHIVAAILRESYFSHTARPLKLPTRVPATDLQRPPRRALTPPSVRGTLAFASSHFPLAFALPRFR